MKAANPLFDDDISVIPLDSEALVSSLRGENSFSTDAASNTYVPSIPRSFEVVLVDCGVGVNGGELNREHDCLDVCNNGTTEQRNPKDADDHSQFTDEIDASWMEKYRELKAFASEKGHCNVPRSFGALGPWVSHQRRKMRQYERHQKAVNKKLRRQMKMLKDIGLNAYIGKGNSAKVNGLLLGTMKAWDEQYTKLLRYREIEGHCNVPTKSTLGRWVSRQRASYRKYRVIEQGRLVLRGGNDLHARFQRLSSIGFNFTIGTGKGGRKNLSKMP